MAGGTGGHVYPALAIALYLREHGMQLFWLGTRTGLEARVVPENRIRLYAVNISGLRGKGLWNWIVSPFRLLAALMQSIRIISNLRPSIVLGLGGFASGPGGIAAWLLRIPLYIHEQNSVAGLTNRLLAPFAKCIMVGFPKALQGKKVVITGNPVRREISAVGLARQGKTLVRHQPLKLLVLGGSLGARALNEVLPGVLAALPDDIDINVWHQTGDAHFDTTMAHYRKFVRREHKVVPYINNMSEAYEWADLVLCRSGALTVSEISVVGISSILVPYPYAADDHQTANAEYLSKAGAAILVPQAELNPERVKDLLCRFASDREKLLEMARIARRQAFPDATLKIGNICLEAAKCPA